MEIPVEYEIELLTYLNGVCPFHEWYETLLEKDRLIVDKRLARVRYGLFGDTNSLGNGLYELKFHKGKGFRIYFAQLNNNRLVIIMAGDKGTQKRDIIKAKELLLVFKAGDI